jgi:hypothetical protein
MREPRVFEDVRYLVADERVDALRQEAEARRTAAMAQRAADRRNGSALGASAETRDTHARRVASRPGALACADD